MRIATVCFLLREEEVLLARKKRKDGAGWWNGYGGDVERGETAVAAAAREVREECGVFVAESDLEQRAHVRTYQAGVPHFELLIFLARSWSGRPSETEEMGPPRSFGYNELPFDEMFPDNRMWLSRVLIGEKLEADVYLSPDGKSVDTITFRKPTF